MSNAADVFGIFSKSCLEDKIQVCAFSDRCQNMTICMENFVLEDFFNCGRQVYIKKPNTNPPKTKPNNNKKKTI